MPTEPVDPRTTTFVTGARPSGAMDAPWGRERRSELGPFMPGPPAPAAWGHRQQRVDAVEHAAVAGQQAAAVLGTHRAALDQRLDQVTDHAHRAQEEQREAANGSPRRTSAARRGLRDPTADWVDHPRPDAASTGTPAMPLHTLPALAGLIAGRACAAGKRRPPKAGRDVGHPDQTEDREKEVDADRCALRQRATKGQRRAPAQHQAHVRTGRGMPAQPARHTAPAPPSTQTSVAATTARRRARPTSGGQRGIAQPAPSARCERGKPPAGGQAPTPSPAAMNGPASSGERQRVGGRTAPAGRRR